MAKMLFQEYFYQQMDYLLFSLLVQIYLLSEHQVFECFGMTRKHCCSDSLYLIDWQRYLSFVMYFHLFKNDLNALINLLFCHQMQISTFLKYLIYSKLRSFCHLYVTLLVVLSLQMSAAWLFLFHGKSIPIKDPILLEVNPFLVQYQDVISNFSISIKILQWEKGSSIILKQEQNLFIY